VNSHENQINKAELINNLKRYNELLQDKINSIVVAQQYEYAIKIQELQHDIITLIDKIENI
jgi:hypothetical protein